LADVDEIRQTAPAFRAFRPGGSLAQERMSIGSHRIRMDVAREAVFAAARCVYKKETCVSLRLQYI
jgi:hypothetical protein